MFLVSVEVKAPQLLEAHVVIERAIFLKMLQVMRGSLMATPERPFAFEVFAEQLVVGNV
jgi:hypothetical protein